MSNGINAVKPNPVMGAAKTLTIGTGVQGVDKTGLCMMKQIQSGALTGGVSQQILNIAGPGVIDFLGLTSDDGTARILSIQVVIDGVMLISAGFGMPASFGNGFIVIGSYQTGSIHVKQDIPFKSSCVITIQSNLTETAKSTLLTSYRTC
ncbi:hypothetical protein [Duganella qianjiadongensis]|uniref:Tox-PAAR-like domain-containing protein n=1 Tax=Duganella qianjiadongensis TaxID=2692176 RepID=A0ABW9VKS4_9BURK|nr:hypothetical protein [Duganella qianjiadongensis]MYM39661.1 hypothetical protein [Duganella qianjiadongensis]